MEGAPFLYNLVWYGYLVAMSMPSNHNWLFPSRDQSGNFLANDWFTEYSTTKDVSNGAIRTSPHFFQVVL